MPLVFRAGLFCTVLVLGGVRLLKSLRGARRRQWAPVRAAGKPGGAKATRVAGRLPVSVRTQTGERWLHIAMVWGVVLFCGPFLVGLAVPGPMARLSARLSVSARGQASLGSGLVGGTPGGNVRSGLTPPAREAIGSTGLVAPQERLASARARRRKDLRVGLAIVLACAGVALAAGLAAGLARKRRRPGLMTAATLAGLVASGAGFALSGHVAGRLSGSRQARRTIDEYASAVVKTPDGEDVIEGPVRLVGRPEPRTPGKTYLFLDRPDSGDANVRREATEPFTVVGVSVSGAGADVMRVARPHVRLGPEGRERFIRADEEVMVLGYAVGGRLVSDPAYPTVVAPADAPRVIERVSADLLGTAGPRARYVALLQVLFAAGLAWSRTVLLASATEYLLRSKPRPAPSPAGGVEVAGN